MTKGVGEGKRAGAVNNPKPRSGSGGCVMTEKNRKAVVRLAIREYLEKQKSNEDLYQRVVDILYPLGVD